MKENKREPVAYHWRVSLVFTVSLDKIDLTPGSGQLPEEIVTKLAAADWQISITPLSESIHLRTYLVTANVRSPESSQAIASVRCLFEKLPSFTFGSARATITSELSE